MSTPAVDSVRIDLPASWQRMPTQEAELRELVQAQRDDEVWKALTPTERRGIEIYVERFIADMRESDARLAALYTERVGADPATSAERGAASPPDDGVLVASCLISILDRHRLGVAVPLTADVVLAAMTLDRSESGRSASGATNVEPPSIVGLRAGQAVRVVRLVEQPLGFPETFKYLTDTYFLPVAPDWHTLLVAQFATPIVDVARTFSELFAGIADTIRFYREGETTTL
jgi:hypothetical protein